MENINDNKNTEVFNPDVETQTEDNVEKEENTEKQDDDKQSTDEQNADKKEQDSQIYIGSPTKRLLLTTGSLLVLFFIIGSGFSSEAPSISIQTKTIVEPNPFENITIEAKAAYVFDTVSNKVYFSKNEEVQLPLASLTKIMTAIVASEFIPDDEIVVITRDAVNVEGDNGLKIGERWKFKDLLDYTLVVSSNDGARAIASAAGAYVDATAVGLDDNKAFISKMNDTATELEMTQSYFINENGLDISEAVGGSYGSARDMALLFSYAIKNKPKLLEATAYDSLNFTSENNFMYDATNTNSIVGEIPGIIGSKTGYTELAGGNLIIAFDAGINHPVIAVVLGSSFDGRFEDMEKLVNASLKKIAQ